MKVASLFLIPLILMSFGYHDISVYQKQVDQKAHSILQKLKKKYNSHNSIEVNFDLHLDHEDGTSEVQKGSLIQQDKKYALDMAEQSIHSDGATVWVYLKNNNEVQIDNFYEEDEEELASLSPRDILNRFDNGDHEYGIVNEGKEGKYSIVQIEFKAIDDDSDYSKMRMTINSKDSEVMRMKVFNKDGSRYTIKVNDIFSNKIYSHNVFIFDTSKYPNIYIEDLRID